MKEVEKKDAPEISGGALPFVTDPPTVPDYPQNPSNPDQTEGERDLPIWHN